MLCKKYVNNLPLGERKLIEYENNNIKYYYDPEICELLYEDDKKILRSNNKKYKYKSYNKSYTFNTIDNKETVQNKMNEENILLEKNNFNELKKSKILRRTKNKE